SSMASRRCTSSTISAGSSPRVWRRTRRASSSEPATPSTTATPTSATAGPGAASSPVSSGGASTRAATSPTVRPSSSSTGTCATTVRPSGLPTHARPASAVLSPIGNGSPTSAGSAALRTTRSASTITISSAPDRLRALVPSAGSGPKLRVARLSRTPAVAATSSATDSIRRPCVSRNAASDCTTASAVTATSSRPTIPSCHPRNCRARVRATPGSVSRPRRPMTTTTTTTDVEARQTGSGGRPTMCATRTSTKRRTMRTRSVVAVLVALAAALLVPPVVGGLTGGGDGTQLRGLRFLVPNAPGGGYDITARTAAKAMEDAGITGAVEVFNLPGAGGTVGLGRTVNESGNDRLVMSMGLGVVGSVYTNESPATLTDTTPIARLTQETEIVVVGK